MAKVIEQWRPLNDGRSVLILDTEVPAKPFKGYRIEGKNYEPEQIHVQGAFLLKVIAIKGEGSFVGKEVEFI